MNGSNRSLRSVALIIVVIMIIGMIAFLESLKPDVPRLVPGAGDVRVASEDLDERARAKEGKYPVAKELVDPAGFINTDKITVQELVGKKIVMIDFWTYSCINCQRTTPYLNAWYERYRDSGLEIIGVHTPEFEFEKDEANVKAAVEKLGIKYPVALDSGYYTWNAYSNQYWPEKYLIDIDGYIVYRHIGEGGYKETEMKIRELLAERAEVLGTKGSTPEMKDQLVSPKAPSVDFASINSPETYFGWARNSNLGSGVPGREGKQTMKAPSDLERNKLYLTGTWNITEEYAENTTKAAVIEFRYNAKSVYMVAESKGLNSVRVLRDGKELTTDAGNSVQVKDGRATVNVQGSTLYGIIDDSEYGEHLLTLIIEDPGLKAYTFTFG